MVKAYINVTLKKSILDPQGEAVKNALEKMNYKTEAVRIGKHIEIDLGDVSKEEADKIVKEITEKLLYNPEIETYNYNIEVI